MLRFIQAIAIVGTLLSASTALADHSDRHMQVHKSPSCGCCTACVQGGDKPGHRNAGMVLSGAA